MQARFCPYRRDWPYRRDLAFRRDWSSPDKVRLAKRGNDGMFCTNLKRRDLFLSNHALDLNRHVLWGQIWAVATFEIESQPSRFLMKQSGSLVLPVYKSVRSLQREDHYNRLSSAFLLSPAFDCSTDFFHQTPPILSICSCDHNPRVELSPSTNPRISSVQSLSIAPDIRSSTAKGKKAIELVIPLAVLPSSSKQSKSLSLFSIFYGRPGEIRFSSEIYSLRRSLAFRRILLFWRSLAFQAKLHYSDEVWPLLCRQSLTFQANFKLH